MSRATLLFALCILAATARAQAVRADDLTKYDARITAADRMHWAYQPVQRPTPPAVSGMAWVRNPIDAFLLSPLEAKGWRPAQEVEPRVWLRRIHYDVVGLPPTPEEISRFETAVAQVQDAAYLAVIDELLARPEYGERWGRHWLDVVRYAETSGYERDAIKPNVWRYRDYVIQSLNEDKPYDRFVLEQLAGDELPDGNAASLIGLGFNRLGPWDDEPADPKEDRFDQLDDIVNATSLVFMGLTMGCARCHDHKFDALTMHDYYRLVAVFNPLQRARKGRAELDMPVGNRAERERLAERNRRIDALLAKVPAGKPLPPEIDAQIKILKAATPDLPRGYFLHEPSGNVPDTHLLLRGKAMRPGPKVEPGFPAVLVAKQTPFPEPGPQSSLRRLTLAQWLVRPDHPLTARVMVNRIWHYHFGEGLVRTPSDFGVMGLAPTHPELLDWLASTFVDSGWSIKKLHRIILSSSAYRMSKRSIPEYAAIDPDNQLWWRFPYKRLEVEAIRDGILAVSGQLNLKRFGPSMYPEVPREALAGSSDPDKIWKPFEEREASRRSVYAFIKRSFVVPMFEVLDICDTTRPNDKRLTTTVAPQALTLFNGAFVQRQARHFADRLRREAGDDAARQIERAFPLALGRAPRESERTALRAFLREQSLEQMCRVIFNLNEFVYVD